MHWISLEITRINWENVCIATPAGVSCEYLLSLLLTEKERNSALDHYQSGKKGEQTEPKK